MLIGKGSGKTTLVSLLCSDHPQSYSLPITYFGRSRLPSESQPGVSIFDIQSRIGQASPEIHRLFPRHLSVRQVLENSWADAFLSKPYLTAERDSIVDACLRWFKHDLDPSAANETEILDDLIAPEFAELGHRSTFDPDARSSAGFMSYLESDIEWADDVQFGELSFAAQRVALFLRAIIKRPEIVVLDEASSGMDDNTMIKCLMFLMHGEKQWFRSSKPSYIQPKEYHHRQTNGTLLAKIGRVSFGGLEPHQALLSICHRLEEVPPNVKRWICLPEANEERPATFGDVDARGEWWDKMWQRDPK